MARIRPKRRRENPIRKTTGKGGNYRKTKSGVNNERV